MRGRRCSRMSELTANKLRQLGETKLQHAERLLAVAEALFRLQVSQGTV